MKRDRDRINRYIRNQEGIDNKLHFDDKSIKLEKFFFKGPRFYLNGRLTRENLEIQIKDFPIKSYLGIRVVYSI